MVIHPHALSRLIKWLVLFVVLVAVVVGIVWWRDGHSHSNDKKVYSPTSNNSSSNINTDPTSVFNKNQYSVNDPSSLWVVVNKGRILPANYAPANLITPKIPLSGGPASENMHLRQDAAGAAEKLIAAASAGNIKLMLVSGYRSYGTQQSVYNGYVSSQGKAYADATSAQPGHSEHQTGLAADLGAQSGKCQLEPCFGDTAEGKWLAANAYKYGFIIRYQKEKTSLTGYAYEPWHMRFVGTDLAAEINKSGQTMEQFFSLPTFSDYPAEKHQLN